jgi:hypothetical protein
MTVTLCYRGYCLTGNTQALYHLFQPSFCLYQIQNTALQNSSLATELHTVQTANRSLKTEFGLQRLCTLPPAVRELYFLQFSVTEFEYNTVKETSF